MLPDLINIFEDDQGFDDRLAVVEEHGDLLVDWIVLEKVRALVRDIFFDVLILDSLQLQRPLDSTNCRTCPHSEELHLANTNHGAEQCDIMPLEACILICELLGAVALLVLFIYLFLDG